MLKKIAILSAIIFALGLMGAASNPPVPGGFKHGSKNKNHAADGPQGTSDDQRGTEGAPIVVKLTTTPQSEKIASNIAKKAHQQATDNRVLVIITGILALAAILQWGALAYQGRWLRRSVLVQERALIELERPIVHGLVGKPGFSMVGNFAGTLELITGDLEILIVNFGRSPAALTRLHYAVTTATYGGIVDPVNSRIIGGRELPTGTVSLNDDPYGETENMRFSFLEDREEILSRKKTVWIVGFVRYEDIFGERYISGFCHALDLASERFVRRGGATYNYSRKEKPSEIPAPS